MKNAIYFCHPPMAKKSNPPSTPLDKKGDGKTPKTSKPAPKKKAVEKTPKPSKPAPPKKEEVKKKKKPQLTEKAKVDLAERKRIQNVKLLEKLIRHTTRELKKQKVYVDEKRTLEFVKSSVLPIFRGLNPRDAKVKDIREFVAELLVVTPTIKYFNPLYIPIGDITGIMWADLDDYLDVDLRAIVNNEPLRVDINAGSYGSTGIFNLQDYQYEATQVNEIYEGIRDVVDNDSNAEWNGRVVVRNGFQDDGNAESYFLQFVLSAGGQEIEPTETFEESIGFEVPKETQAQRRDRLKQVIARKKELASQRRKKTKEKSMRLRDRPKVKEAPATEVKSEAVARQENVKSVLAEQRVLINEAKEFYKDGIYNKAEFKARIKAIDKQINLALSKFKRGGEI